MDNRNTPKQTELTALSIAPDRELASQFTVTLPLTRVFHILAELKSYPPDQTLDIRLRQLRPDVVFVDLASDLDRACELIEFVAAFKPPIFVIGLHKQNDSNAILRSLRAGATEFLYAPFDPDMQREAIGRISRLRRPQAVGPVERGKLIAFTSAKPGSGASTLASQTAFALHRLSHKRILLADFDLWSGTQGFFFKLSHWYSLPDALKQFETGDVDWSSLVVNAEGVDILPAPDQPRDVGIDAERLHDLLEYARSLYDWIVVDLPSVFDKLSLITLSDTDDAFVVSTSELPSLHLTRKAVGYLNRFGFVQERFRVLVNRMGKQEGFTGEDMAKIFGAPVHRTFPNDYLALHKGLTTGQPMGARSPLGKTIEEFAGVLAGKAHVSAKQAAARKTTLSLN